MIAIVYFFVFVNSCMNFNVRSTREKSEMCLMLSYKLYIKYFIYEEHLHVSTKMDGKENTWTNNSISYIVI